MAGPFTFFTVLLKFHLSERPSLTTLYKTAFLSLQSLSSYPALFSFSTCYMFICFLKHCFLLPLDCKLHENRNFLNFILSFWLPHVACGILVPWPGIEPMPPALEAQSLNHLTAREVLGLFKFIFYVQHLRQCLAHYRCPINTMLMKILCKTYIKETKLFPERHQRTEFCKGINYS